MHPLIKPLLGLLFAAPAVWVLVAGIGGQLGPDPAEQLMHVTGEWAARFLILALLVSPLKGRWRVLLQFRRMLGLYAFGYACLHFLTFGHFFLGWTWELLLEELNERPYITAGFLAWLGMLPMAITSTNAMRRRLRHNWQRLQSVVYAVAVLICVHLLWQVRSDFGEALLYCLLFGGLLSWRLMQYGKKRLCVSNSKVLDSA